MNWPWTKPQPTLDDLILRMRALEQRQEMLEDYTDQKLDSMKAYSARLGKRERDAARGPRSDENGEGNGNGPAQGQNPLVARALARRARRSGGLG